MTPLEYINELVDCPLCNTKLIIGNPNLNITSKRCPKDDLYITNNKFGYLQVEIQGYFICTVFDNFCDLDICDLDNIDENYNIVNRWIINFSTIKHMIDYIKNTDFDMVVNKLRTFQ